MAHYSVNMPMKLRESFEDEKIGPWNTDVNAMYPMVMFLTANGKSIFFPHSPFLL